MVLERIFKFSIERGTLEEQKAGQDFDNSAHIVKIHYRSYYTDVLNYNLKNFVYSHKCYVHPNYILENDHVTLYGFTRTHVFFSITSPSVDVYNTRKFPFVYLAQNAESQHLLILPIWAFHKARDSVDRNYRTFLKFPL